MRVGLANEQLLLLREVVGRPRGKHFGHFGQVALVGFQNGAHPPHKDAGIPHKVTTVDKQLGQVSLGLVGERLHFFGRSRPVVVILNVGIAGRRASRLNAQDEKLLRVVGNDIHRFVHITNKSHFSEDSVFGGRNHHHRVRISFADLVRRVANPRGGSSPHRLGQDLRLGQVRQLVSY